MTELKAVGLKFYWRVGSEGAAGGGLGVGRGLGLWKGRGLLEC